MEPTKRIILNTFVQYFRSILNIFLSLFSTRYIVEALGKSDYGIYLLVGGVVAMLGFITNALTSTTQRFISYHFGKNNTLMVKKVFANTLFVHFSVSLLLIAVLSPLRHLIVFDILNIPAGREIAALQIYDITVGLLVVTVLIALYKAIFIAHENITFISIVEIADGFIKLGIAILVLFTDNDKLLLYAFLMFLVQVLNLIALFAYSWKRYGETRSGFSFRQLDRQCIKQLTGFAGWSTYGMAAVVFRTQGIQWLLNISYNTIMNAAYGIAMQVYGSVSFVASSVLNAMNPQIMKAEGEGNRKRMLQLVELESKYSTMLLIMVITPIIVEMPAILSFWLSDVPEYTDMFCRFILIGFIIDQSTYGINSANQAMGKIKTYTLTMYTPKLLVLIPIYVMLHERCSPFYVMCVYLLSELLVACARVPYIKHACGLRTGQFLKDVIFPLVPLVIAELAIGYICTRTLDMNYRFLLTIPLSMLLGCMVIWYFLLTKQEKGHMLSIVGKKLHK